MGGFLLLPRLMWRPASILVIVWSAMLVLAMRPERLLLTIPLFLGFLIGQVAIEARSRYFAWMLPNLRRDLLRSIMAMGIICALVCLLVRPTQIPLWTVPIHALAAYMLGTCIQLQEYTIVYYKSLVSVACWILVILWIAQFHVFLNWTADEPVRVSLLLAVFIIACAVFQGHPSTHRNLCFSPLITFTSSCNKTARSWYERKVREQKGPSPRGRTFAWHEHPKTIDWVRVGVFESLGQYGHWLPLQIISLMTLFLVISTLVSAKTMYISFLMVTLVGCFQWPIMPRTTLLYPLNRQQLFKLSYFSAIFEMLMYSGCGAVTLLLLHTSFVQYFIAPFRDLDTARSLLLVLTVTPVLQVVRRCFGLNIIVIMFVWMTISIVTGVVSSVLFKYVPTLNLWELATYLTAIPLFQLVLYWGLRRHYLQGDLNPIP